ncbi:D-alanyl-D-alanine carboxypeptidase/D-alanyl-D-alanine-endopeptidase [Halothiobacillus sp. DCM-1]|uniref:D-alanyl-D-alanine carboxypeptidase/D-alanyl-D-alanine endopeptidase n=1 Tax=Halothiobacillus sp. DCM-1 TaxID=3112558 RepID=UPI003255DD20
MTLRPFLRHFTLSLLIALLPLSLGRTAQAAEAVPPAVIAALKQQKLNLDDMGVWVQAVDSRKPLIEHLPDQLFTPASVMKLVTSVAALDILGPNYQWPTRAYADALPVNGVIHGNLYIKGSGDPWFRSEDLWDLVRQLHDLGVREITGDLVLDNSYFDLGPADPAEFDGHPERVYNALPQALLLDNRATRVLIAPDGQRGEPIIKAWPPNQNLTVSNEMKLVRGSCSGKNNQPAIAVIGSDTDTPKLNITGTISTDCQPDQFYLVAGNANDSFYAAFAKLFAEQGGKLNGHWREGLLPKNAVFLAQHNSENLTQYLYLMNKWSNNLMARQIFLTLGAEIKGAPGTLEKSKATIAQWQKEQGFNWPGFDIENGSGLSRKARLSPRMLGELLMHAWQSATMPELMASLPIAGIDGTMRKRMRGEPARGMIYLKTGTLRNVRSGAGYILTESGRRYVIVIMQNETNVQNGGGTKVQDALLNWLYKNG